MSNPWVAISKRYPKTGTEYQCYTNDGHIVICYFGGAFKWTINLGFRYFGDMWGSDLSQKLSPRRKVTHWKILPKPPKDAEKKVKFYK